MAAPSPTAATTHGAGGRDATVQAATDPRVAHRAGRKRLAPAARVRPRLAAPRAGPQITGARLTAARMLPAPRLAAGARPPRPLVASAVVGAGGSRHAPDRARAAPGERAATSHDPSHHP